jgi:hypothetical protein
VENLVNTTASEASKVLDKVTNNIATGLNSATEKINSSVNAKAVPRPSRHPQLAAKIAADLGWKPSDAGVGGNTKAYEFPNKAAAEKAAEKLAEIGFVYDASGLRTVTVQKKNTFSFFELKNIGSEFGEKVNLYVYVPGALPTPPPAKAAQNKVKRKKSSVPFYLAAATWITLSVSGGFYSLRNILGAAVIALGVYFIGSKIFKGKKLPTEEPKQIERFSETGNTALDGLLSEGQLGLRELGRLRRSIRDDEVSSKVMQIELVTQKILQNSKDDTRDVAKSRKFLNYYLPTTIRLLNSYDRMVDIDGENAGNTVKRIESLLDDLIAAYNKHYDSLFSDEALDVETDIRVLEATLRQEGLL